MLERLDDDCGSSCSSRPVLNGLTLSRRAIRVYMQALSHCQVPCGIFQDQARVKAMMEDAVTIRKAMVQTAALSEKVAAGDAQSLNQSCRWISTKDDHADKILRTTADYFLANTSAT